MALATDTETLVSVALMLLAAAIVCYLGYRIRYRGDVVLIAGYDSDGVTDDEGLGDLVGGVVIALGLVHVVFGLALLAVAPNLEFWLAYLAAMFVGLGVVQVRGRRYTA
jgi:hypothetical protein